MRKDCLHTINQSQKKTSTSFIILSAGKNKTRGEKCCKGLLKYGKDKLVDDQIKTIKRYDRNAEIVITTGYDSHSINDYIFKKYSDIRIVENPRYEYTTALESFRLGLNCCLKSNVFCIHGDQSFNLESLKVPDLYKNFVIMRGIRKNKDNIGIVHNEDNVVRMSYGVDNPWGEIIYFPQEYFSLIRQSFDKCKKYHNIFELINLLIEDGVNFHVHKNNKIKINKVFKK